jgi:hypothetical protein
MRYFILLWGLFCFAEPTPFNYEEGEILYKQGKFYAVWAGEEHLLNLKIRHIEDSEMEGLVKDSKNLTSREKKLLEKIRSKRWLIELESEREGLSDLTRADPLRLAVFNSKPKEGQTLTGLRIKKVSLVDGKPHLLFIFQNRAYCFRLFEPKTNVYRMMPLVEQEDGRWVVQSRVNYAASLPHVSLGLSRELMPTYSVGSINPSTDDLGLIWIDLKSNLLYPQLLSSRSSAVRSSGSWIKEGKFFILPQDWYKNFEDVKNNLHYLKDENRLRLRSPHKDEDLLLQLMTRDISLQDEQKQTTWVYPMASVRDHFGLQESQISNPEFIAESIRDSQKSLSEKDRSLGFVIPELVVKDNELRKKHIFSLIDTFSRQRIQNAESVVSYITMAMKTSLNARGVIDIFTNIIATASNAVREKTEGPHYIFVDLSSEKNYMVKEVAIKNNKINYRLFSELMLRPQDRVIFLFNEQQMDFEQMVAIEGPEKTNIYRSDGILTADILKAVLTSEIKTHSNLEVPLADALVTKLLQTKFSLIAAKRIPLKAIVNNLLVAIGLTKNILGQFNQDKIIEEFSRILFEQRPPPFSKELVEKVLSLRQNFSANSPVHGNVAYVGIDTQLQLLSNALGSYASYGAHHGDPRLILTLLGDTGLGKTDLLLSTIHHLKDTAMEYVNFGSEKFVASEVERDEDDGEVVTPKVSGKFKLLESLKGRIEALHMNPQPLKFLVLDEAHCSKDLMELLLSATGDQDSEFTHALNLNGIVTVILMNTDVYKESYKKYFEEKDAVSSIDLVVDALAAVEIPKTLSRPLAGRLASNLIVMPPMSDKLSDIENFLKLSVSQLEKQKKIEIQFDYTALEYLKKIVLSNAGSGNYRPAKKSIEREVQLALGSAQSNLEGVVFIHFDPTLNRLFMSQNRVEKNTSIYPELLKWKRFYELFQKVLDNLLYLAEKNNLTQKAHDFAPLLKSVKEAAQLQLIDFPDKFDRPSEQFVELLQKYKIPKFSLVHFKNSKKLDEAILSHLKPLVLKYVQTGYVEDSKKFTEEMEKIIFLLLQVSKNIYFGEIVQDNLTFLSPRADVFSELPSFYRDKILQEPTTNENIGALVAYLMFSYPLHILSSEYGTTFPVQSLFPEENPQSCAELLTNKIKSSAELWMQMKMGARNN